MRLAQNSAGVICCWWGARGRASGQEKRSKKKCLQKEPHFHFLYTQSKLHTCVKQSWKTWHSAARFTNQLFKLMLFYDMLLGSCEKKMQGLVEISGVFLSCFSQRPENLILMEGRKKVEGLLFPPLCVFWDCSPPALSVAYLSASGWIPVMKLSSSGIWKLRMREGVWNQQTDRFHCLLHSDEIHTPALLLIFYSLFSECAKE